MALHLYRATVRGHFAALDDELAARLRAEADDHDHLHAAFTADGTFTYEPSLVAFSFRYELHVEEEDQADADAHAELVALQRAEAWLAAAGIGAKHLRVSATDMASAWSRVGGGTPGPRRRPARR